MWKRNKTVALVGAGAGFALFLAVALLPALMYGGYAGLLLATGIFGTPAEPGFLARGLVLFGMLLGREAKVQIENVAYRGAGPLMSDLQDGRIPAGFAGVPSLLPNHRGGRIRILATSGRKRVGAAPNLPTALELGHPSLELDEWYGFFVGPSTPAALVAEWNRQI